jgi:hypothetical protein
MSYASSHVANKANPKISACEKHVSVALDSTDGANAIVDELCK